MQVSPQTNTTLKEVAEVILGHQTFAICGHISPDGDCLGSGLALGAALRSLDKQVTNLLARDDEVDSAFSYMEGFEGLALAADFTDAVDCFIAVDVPMRERLADAATVLDRAAVSIVLDHHEVPDTMADLTYAVPDSASTSVIVWQLLDELGVEKPSGIATCAYTGLMTDTGRFQYQNADSVAFAAAAEMVAAGARPDEIAKCVYQNRRLASVKLEGVAIERMHMLSDGAAALSWITHADFEACDATKADSEPLIDVLRSLQGVRVACMLREQGEEIRGSFRAKDDTDVAAVAREFGGGGHKAAAGFTLRCSIEEAVDVISERLTKLMGE